MYTAKQARQTPEYEPINIEETIQMISKDIEERSKSYNFSIYELPRNPKAINEIKKELAEAGYNVCVQDMGKVHHNRQFSDMFVDWSRMLGDK